MRKIATLLIAAGLLAGGAAMTTTASAAVCIHEEEGTDWCVPKGNVVIVDPCLADPSLPTCVNDAIDQAEGAVEAARGLYNNDVQPTLDSGACAAYTALTGKPCPRLVPQL